MNLKKMAKKNPARDQRDMEQGLGTREIDENVLRYMSNKGNLSQETRARLLQFNTKKVEGDPFRPEIQNVFNGFVDYVEESSPDDIDLRESGLLLYGAGKIYAAQADALLEDVLRAADLLRIKEEDAVKEKTQKRKRERGDAEEDSVERTEESAESSAPAAEVTNEEDTVPAEETVVNEEEGKAEASPVDETIGASCDTTDTTTDIDSASPIDPPVEGTAEKTENCDDNLLKRSHEENEADAPPKKKHKNGLIPPTLMSCFEEYEILKSAGLFDDRDNNHIYPPLLSKAIRLTARKLYAEDNIPLKKAKDRDDALVAALNKDKSQNELSAMSDDHKPPPLSRTFSFSQEFPHINTTNFSSEDQASIQECINELHYLPFTFGLSRNDLTLAFSKTVGRMSQIFRNNNVAVTCNMINETSVISPKSSPTKDDKPLTPAPSNGRIHPVVHNLGDIYSTLVKMCREECESFINNSSQSILEKPKETTFAESRATIRAMIQDLQKNIVPKFCRVPLMAENTPEFFQHVTNFEKKMKKILEEEAKKDEFDVRKYERDVLEVTTKESSELERCDDVFVIPGSPAKSQSIDGGESSGEQQGFMSPSTRSSFDGSQSSSGATGWVPLKHIFHHMKNFDRTETARSFYAVLALLSYQNLDINYDQLYSAESAKLIEKHLDKFQHREDDLDSVVSRGMKIVTSRCPDVDKEEVFIAALTSESRDEAFRHLLAKESKNIAIRDRMGAPSTSSSSKNNNNDNDDDNLEKGLHETLADFVEESCTNFSGCLHSKRKKKKKPKDAG